MTMRVRFDTDNDAFDGAIFAECARILHAIADRVEAGEDFGRVSDLNGNKVGTFTLTLPGSGDE